MQKLKEYTKHPGSFIVFILIILATIITVGTMLFLVAYILLKGIPNITPQLFEWKYNSDNVSMSLFRCISCGVRKKRIKIS